MRRVRVLPLYPQYATTTTASVADAVAAAAADLQVEVLHDYEQVRAYFPNTLLLAREKVAAGRTEVVLTDSHLQQANIAMQKHDSDEWCAA